MTFNSDFSEIHDFSLATHGSGQTRRRSGGGQQHLGHRAACRQWALRGAAGHVAVLGGSRAAGPVERATVSTPSVQAQVGHSNYKYLQMKKGFPRFLFDTFGAVARFFMGN